MQKGDKVRLPDGTQGIIEWSLNGKVGIDGSVFSETDTTLLQQQLYMNRLIKTIPQMSETELREFLIAHRIARTKTVAHPRAATAKKATQTKKKVTNDIDALEKSGKLSPEVIARLREMQQK